MNSSPAMTIGQLARAADVGIETVRYYQRLRLIPEPKRALGSVRRYGDDIVQRIAFIRRAQRLGFTLSEIKTLFTLDAKRDRHRAHQFARVKLSEFDQRIADMTAMRSALAGLVDACTAGDAQLPCPIIDAFAGKGVSH